MLSIATSLVKYKTMVSEGSIHSSFTATYMAVFRVDGVKSTEKSIKMGIPQGTFLDPLYFIINNNYFLE